MRGIVHGRLVVALVEDVGLAVRMRPRCHATTRSKWLREAAHRSRSNTRTVPFIHAVSGMMLNAEPALTCVTLTTTSLSGSALRLAMLCSAVDHVRQATHRVATPVRHGGVRALARERHGELVHRRHPRAGVTPILPSGRSCHTCRPNAASGLARRARRPGSSPRRRPGRPTPRRAGSTARTLPFMRRRVLDQLLRDAEQDDGVAVVTAGVHACPATANGRGRRSPRGSAARPCRRAAARSCPACRR